MDRVERVLLDKVLQEAMVLVVRLAMLVVVAALVALDKQDVLETVAQEQLI
jgi:hypothetical protein